MPYWFVYDKNGVKRGPISSAQLKTLVESGKINRDTVLETDSGHKGDAGQIRGLFPPTEPSPFEMETTPAAPSPIVSSGAFCSNCGNPISPQAVACMKCSADPRANKNFCRTCGARLNPNQVVCVKCGSSVKTKKKKSKILAAIFAFFLGMVGIHKFYLGDQDWGIFYIVLFLTGFFLIIPAIIVGIMSCVDGIKLLLMSEEKFRAKHCSE